MTKGKFSSGLICALLRQCHDRSRCNGGGSELDLSGAIGPLRLLHFSSCRNVDDAVLDTIGCLFGDSITKLSLYDCKKVTSHGLARLAVCSKLESLDLRMCSDLVTCEGVLAMCSGGHLAKALKTVFLPKRERRMAGGGGCGGVQVQNLRARFPRIIFA